MANLVSCEAKIDAKPGEAERNFQLLKRKMKTDQDNHANIIADNNDLEGSGDDYDDDDDDYEEGSGDLLFGTEQDTNVILNPDSQDDFHFVDDMASKKPSEASDDDLLYEYYNDLLYGEKDDDYYEELKEDLGKDFDRQDQETFIVDDVIEIPVENPSSGYVFRPA